MKIQYLVERFYLDNKICCESFCRDSIGEAEQTIQRWFDLRTVKDKAGFWFTVIKIYIPYS